MKQLLCVTIAIGGSLLVTCGRPAVADEKPSDWMKQKLEMSQNILAGLTKGDFDAVETNAQKMNVVNHLEKLVAADQPHYKEYMRQLAAFESANRELLRQSGKKNIEGSTLAYVQLTVSCVQCHRVVRDAKKKCRFRPPRCAVHVWPIPPSHTGAAQRGENSLKTSACFEIPAAGTGFAF